MLITLLAIEKERLGDEIMEVAHDTISEELYAMLQTREDLPEAALERAVAQVEAAVRLAVNHIETLDVL